MLQLDTRTCDKCGLVQEQDGRYCRNCGNSLPSWGVSGAIPPARSFPFDLLPSHYELRWGRAGTVIVGLVIIVFAWWFIDAAVNAAQQAQAAAQQRQAELDREAAAAAQAAAEARERKLNEITAHLQAANPRSWFGRYPGDYGHVTVNKALTLCTVLSLNFGRVDGKDGLAVNVGMMGIQREPQAPVVNVTLYDENGTVLARKAIVKFISNDLAYGETRQVEDTMDYPVGETPVFVSADEYEEGQSPSPAASDTPSNISSPDSSPSPVAPARPAVRYTNSYQQAMADLKATLESRGYTVYWPHHGDPETLGVVVPDSADGGLKNTGDEKVVANAVDGSFEDVHSKYPRHRSGHIIVQFEPSGSRLTATVQ